MSRLTSVPHIISLVPDLLGPGSHPMKQAVTSLLQDPRIEHVDLVSYAADLKTLRNLGVLQSRQRTRVLVVPPGGASYTDARELTKISIPGLTIREVHRARVSEVVHLKLLILGFSGGRTCAVFGSSNYTRPGTGEASDYPNNEFNVLVELAGPQKEETRKVFNILWDEGSRAVDPSGFKSKTSEATAAAEEVTLLQFQESALNLSVENSVVRFTSSSEAGR